MESGRGVEYPEAVGLNCIALLLYCSVEVVARFLLGVLENYGIIFLPTMRGRK